MTFKEVLAQVIEWLQQDERVSYRALKRQFDLDDDYLEDLTYELVDIQQRAVDLDGKMLVWVDQASLIPEAERRQLTVMFCDLVNSTALARQLDPEAFREVVRAYQATCAEVIEPAGGYIAQYLGDGLLVYFGYPQVHEDSAQQAVRTGLEILKAMSVCNMQLAQNPGVRLAVRVGIHTGLVVVGDIGSGGRREQLALGETPNLAARLQSLAAPDTMVISATTYQLVQGYFVCHDLGPYPHKDGADLGRIYRVLSESGARHRLEVAPLRELTPFVGREQEIEALLARWTHVKEGRGQVVLISGEAGVGKSRLVQTLQEQLVDEPHVQWECRCVSAYQHTAWYPIVDLIQNALHWQEENPPYEKLEKLECLLGQCGLVLEAVIPLFADILGLPLPEDRYPPLFVSPQQQRRHTLDALSVMVCQLAEQQPAVLIVEDVHWADPSTLEWLDLLIGQIIAERLFILLTYRPDWQPPWSDRAYLRTLALNPLPHPQVEQMTAYIAGETLLPPEVVQHIVEKTDGIPLFVEELTQMVLESELLRVRQGRYELTGSLSSLAIPATLRDSLMARLDRLVTAKGVAQLGATLGRQFSYALLRAISELDEDVLQRELERLVAADLLQQRGMPPLAAYTFKHTLVQETAYQSLLLSTRQQYHRRITQVLVHQFPETVATQPELLAHHATEAGLEVEAVDYWQQAGQRAIQRSAYAEAASHFSQGLAVLSTLPETEDRTAHELRLLTSLGPALMAMKGQASTDVEQVYFRAQALCQQLGDPSQLFSVLLGLWSLYLIRAELPAARQVGERLLKLAEHQPDPELQLEAHRALGSTLFWLGEFMASREHFEQVISLYDPQQHHGHAIRYGTDPGVFAKAYVAYVLWFLGYGDQAAARSQEAITLAQELAHPLSLAMALALAAALHQCRRDVQATQDCAQLAVAVSSEQGFAQWLSAGLILDGWVLAEQGQSREGAAQILRGFEARSATEAEVGQPYFLVLHAEAYARGGQVEAGLRLLDEALALVEHDGIRAWEAVIVHRKGELLQQSASTVPQAEACLHHALTIARGQQAKVLELRAAVSLSRLWRQQGKQDEARQLLAAAYSGFTEGFDTADLQEAKTLLAELAE